MIQGLEFINEIELKRVHEERGKSIPSKRSGEDFTIARSRRMKMTLLKRRNMERVSNQRYQRRKIRHTGGIFDFQITR